jgi:hypothetical protein
MGMSTESKKLEKYRLTGVSHQTSRLFAAIPTFVFISSSSLTPTDEGTALWGLDI